MRRRPGLLLILLWAAALAAHAAPFRAEEEAAARAALSRAESDHGADSSDAARAIDLLVEILQRGGKWTDAEMLALARRAVAIREKQVPSSTLELATSLSNLGRALREGSEPATAKPYLEKTLSLRESVLPADHPDVAQALHDLAVLEKDLGHYASALALHERSLSIRERRFGADDLTVAESLNGLGVTLKLMGEMERARASFERALTIREKALGPTSPAVAATLRNLGNLLRAAQDYAGAEPLYRRALAIEEGQPDPDPFEIATATSSLANLLFETDDYRAARKLYERALELFERTRGPEHLDTARASRNLANLLVEMGDYTEARAIYERALAIREKALGPDHPDVAGILNNLGELLRRTGDLDAARPLLERGLAIRERALGADHRDVARSLRYVAALRRDSGELAEARAAMVRAMSIEEKTSGPESNMIAQDTMTLGGILAQSGDLAAARRAFDRAETIFAKTGFDDTHRAMALADGAKVSYLQGDPTAALDQALRAEAIARETFKQVAGALSEREAFAHEATRSTGLDVALSVASLRPAGLDASRILNEIVRSRSMLLDEFASRHRVVRSSRSATIESRWRALVRARETLSRLLVRGGESDNDGSAGKLSSARDELERAERMLAEASSRYRLEMDRRAAGLKEVAASLRKGSALVSFVRYQQIDRGESPSRVPAYFAFVLGSGASRPAPVALGRAEVVDALIRNWREVVGRDPRSADSERAEAEYREAGNALRRAIWDPLETSLAGARQVYIVPDGAIHLVSFATLPTTRGRFLLETGPMVHYLTTERDLIEGKDESPAGGAGLLALGGADFESRVGGADASATVAAAGGREGASFRGLPPGCRDFSSVKFTPLDASRAEVDRIEALWNTVRTQGGSRGGALKLTGSEAREEAFKSLAPGRRIVHVATHGFFVDASCTAAMPGAKARTPAPLWGGSDEAPEDNPLRLSGLAFAGANRREEAAATVNREDGILTSEEIASIDLSGVEEVVLSACETGVGNVVHGEGVLGLRRAFEVAGARSLVMSLWPIDDHATRAWMTRFYESRLEGASTAAAARDASLDVLGALRARRMPPHPFFWGAFVATGDWR